MRVMVTGHLGYVGSVLTPMLTRHGHQVTGVDSALFHDSSGYRFPPVPAVEIGPGASDVVHHTLDVRDLGSEHLRGIDAVVHLAAVSNDPWGDLDPSVTHDVNERASVRLAKLARDAGVGRFVFASSCSVYGAGRGSEEIGESVTPQPLTPYGSSKLAAETEILALASDSFYPTVLRSATAFGVAPAMRIDLVINAFALQAVRDGILTMTSDGRAYRPLVHVRDLAAAHVAVLHAPPNRVQGKVYNVGAEKETRTVMEMAEAVARAVPGSRTRLSSDAGPDPRSYRVSFSSIRADVDGFRAEMSLKQGVIELVDAFRNLLLTNQDLGEVGVVRWRRIDWIRTQVAAGHLDRDLRWRK